MSMAPWGYVVLLGAFIAVFGFTRPRPKQEEQQGKQTMNMEIALEQFMENMESDNRELVELVKQSQQDNAQQLAVREKRIIDLEHRCAELETKLVNAVIQPAGFVQAASEIVMPRAEFVQEQPQVQEAEPEPPRPTIRDRYPELFEMYDQGKSVEAVARKLNRNKGEVQLIIQLAKQEEGANV